MSSSGELASCLLMVSAMWKEQHINAQQRSDLKDWLLSRDEAFVAQAKQVLVELQHRPADVQLPPKPHFDESGYPSLTSPSRHASGNINQLRSSQLTELVDAIEDECSGFHCGLTRVEKMPGEDPIFMVFCALSNSDEVYDACFVYDFGRRTHRHTHARVHTQTNMYIDTHMYTESGQIEERDPNEIHELEEEGV